MAISQVREQLTVAEFVRNPPRHVRILANAKTKVGPASRRPGQASHLMNV